MAKASYSIKKQKTLLIKNNFSLDSFLCRETNRSYKRQSPHIFVSCLGYRPPPDQIPASSLSFTDRFHQLRWSSKGKKKKASDSERRTEHIAASASYFVKSCLASNPLLSKRRKCAPRLLANLLLPVPLLFASRNHSISLLSPRDSLHVRVRM